MRRFASSLGSLALALVVGASAASAQTAYTSRAAFEAALSSFTTATFEGIAPPGTSFPVGIPFTALPGPFNINSTNDVEFFVNSATFAGGGGTLGSGDAFSPQAVAGTNDIEITTTAGFLAFGFDYGAPTGTIFHLFLDGVAFPAPPNSDLVYTQPVTPLAPLTPQFFGFITAVPVTEVRIETDAESPIYDNFTLGTPAVTNAPEPATVALLGAGLVALGAAARRRRKA